MSFKKFALPIVIAVMACGQSASAQSDDGAKSGVYSAESGHRYITFSYSHLGYSNPWLRWRDWDATLDWNAEDPAASSISVTINASSIDSGVDVFDGHLKGDSFFDVANHPEITFVSTNIETTGDTTGMITGDLTIKGVTKPVTLDAVFNKGAYESRRNEYKLGFSAKAIVKRSDYGVDAYAPAVSDDVDVIIEAEFTMPGDS